MAALGQGFDRRSVLDHQFAGLARCADRANAEYRLATHPQKTVKWHIRVRRVPKILGWWKIRQGRHGDQRFPKEPGTMLPHQFAHRPPRTQCFKHSGDRVLMVPLDLRQALPCVNRHQGMQLLPPDFTVFELYEQSIRCRNHHGPIPIQPTSSEKPEPPAFLYIGTDKLYGFGGMEAIEIKITDGAVEGAQSGWCGVVARPWETLGCPLVTNPSSFQPSPKALRTSSDIIQPALGQFRVLGGAFRASFALSPRGDACCGAPFDTDRCSQLSSVFLRCPP